MGHSGSSSTRTAWWLGCLSFALAVAFVVAPTYGHIDDPDASLYRVLTRHLVEDHRWLDLRFVPGIYPQFREHLPFGFWPYAAAMRLFGEGALPLVGALFSLGTVLIVWRVAARLSGEAAGTMAVLLLGTNDSFATWAARVRLDQPLFFFGTAAAAVVLVSRDRLRDWLLAAVLAALAALVKGPFGLVLLAAAVAARMIVERSWRVALAGAVTGLVALLPVVSFALWDRGWGGGTWWQGYFRNQILASATGGRTDGHSELSFPLVTIAGHFWPGLPFVLGAIVLVAVPAWGRRWWSGDEAAVRTQRKVVLFALFAVAALLVPHRKLWYHTVVTYPALALAGGVTLAPLFERLLSTAWRQRWSLTGAALVVVAAWSAVFAGLGARLLRPPCLVSREFAPVFQRAPQHASVLVVMNHAQWWVPMALADEWNADAWLANALPVSADIRPPGDARLAVVPADELPPAYQPWIVRAQARGWVVLERP